MSEVMVKEEVLVFDTSQYLVFGAEILNPYIKKAFLFKHTCFYNSLGKSVCSYFKILSLFIDFTVLVCHKKDKLYTTNIFGFVESMNCPGLFELSS